MKQTYITLLFVFSITGSSLCRAQYPEQNTTSTPQVNVTAEQLVDAADTPQNWLTYSGSYNGQRYSVLDEINTETVADLKLEWVKQFPISEPFECSPLVVGGVMFVTLPENKVRALDARTGLVYWEYNYILPSKLAVCCGKVNRGLAIRGDTLYMGTLDAKLVAIDSVSGREKWIKTVGDPADGFSITAAPLIVKDMVITGVAGGEYGIRGYLDAYDAETGDHRWRSHTIPKPGEDGSETWEGDSWKYGGAPTWMTGSYDPELDLLYWGVGNPGPDWNGEVREGNNLYSDCVLAIHPDDGEVEWFFQFTPHDVHDWDACQIPVLVDMEFHGEQRKLMLFPNRNAFYYVLDRENGDFLHGNAFALQNWAKGLDQNGSPIRIPGRLPSLDGVKVAPDVSGAANWQSPTYSPKTNLIYIMAFDGYGEYFMAEDPERRKGFLFVGGTGVANEFVDKLPQDYVSAVRALNPVTGEKVWDFKVYPKTMSGLVSTAGNVVFGGTRLGNFFALDASTGEKLWHRSLGGRVHAAPITYQVDGKQFVTIAAGANMFTFGL
jgi:alcohol dehydrogenase (cytochrome c)